MPRRFFKKFAIKRHDAGNNGRLAQLLAPFRGFLHEPRFWGIRRRTVVPAVAVGLFVAFLPFPGHPLFAGLLALAFRINIPVAAVTTFVSNPLTMGPMYYTAYRLGRRLLGLEPSPFEFELSLAWVTEKFVAIWQPMLLGSLLLGIASALVAFAILDLLWRASVHDYKSRKRRQRRDRQSG